MTNKHSGALALTWTNKQLSLLSHENGTYEWVDPTDFRVSEVRLLHDVKSIGQVHADKKRAQDNLLIRGDSLHALTSLLRIPEFSSEYEGKVKLVYIDPPFNTGQAFEHYDDGLEHSVWLTMLRDRLKQIQLLLSDDGTVWVHLDDVEVHRARMVMDEVLGIKNYISTIIWEKKKKPSFLHGQMAGVTDFILVYGKDRSKVEAFTAGTSTAGKGIPFHNQGNSMGTLTFSAGTVTFGIPDQVVEKGDMSSATIETELLTNVQIEDGTNADSFQMRGEWRFSQRALDEMVEKGDIIRISKDPFRPNLIRDGTTGKKITNVFSFRVNGVPANEDAREEMKALFSQSFATPKPEGLMERIISVTSREGDIVLDCFAGSGTTAAVAQKMGRRWVTCEWSAENITKFALPRLEKVVNGKDPGGVTEQVGWEGGGGFRLLDVAPSVYEIDGATVLLADSVTAGELAESVAAQLGFEYAPDGVFVGRKGRMRLSVIDGVLNDDIVNLLVGALGEKERVTVVATAAAPGAEDLLRNLCSGSRVRKVPRDLAKLSARRSEVVQLVLDGLESEK